MSYFKISSWFLGGSAAGLFYNMDFGRACHDIDVIVPKGSLAKIKENPFILDCTPESSSDSKEGTPHFAFRIANCKVLIDFIECVIDEPEAYLLFKNNQQIAIASPKTLLESKKHYNRLKDTNDVKIIQDFIKKYYEEN